MSRVSRALHNLATTNLDEGSGSVADRIAQSLTGFLPSNAELAVRHAGGRPAPESHIVLDTERNNPIREQFRFLEHRLRKMAHDSGIRRVLVTSSAPKEGKTVVASNLAVTLACSSSRVVLIDADMRGPGSQSLFGLNETLGLADILEGRAKLFDVMLYLDELKINYIPAGKCSTSPADLVRNSRMQDLLGELGDFDWVVLDSPPIGAFADALSLARQVDTVVLVARSGVTRRAELEESLDSLKDSKIAGVVLNAHDQSRKMGSYYGYYAGKQAKQ